jgi:hypothetical protein
MTAKQKWKISKDPLYRGENSSNPTIPTPQANKAIVRHILYLEGQGRETPYLSTSESEDTARRFAGRNGNIFRAIPKEWHKSEVKHRSRKELLDLLKGKGKGDAEWSSAVEVLRAHQYVEEHAEHLADFSAIHPEAAESSVNTIFKK